MKILILILIYINFAFCSSENISLMNDVKDVIQKEEYISLALNKYILQTATIPKKSDNSLDWTKLETTEYLGTNFNKTNPLTNSNIIVTFDSKNNAFIKGAIETTTKYNSEYNYLYNFYTNKVFRVNTIPPINITKEKLALGSQVLYNDIQKEIASVLNETTPKDIKFPNQTCASGKYFYELSNEKLTYEYCKTDNTAIQVYQEEPIYTENDEDLQYIIGEIGAKAYVKIGTSWYEKYFIGLENGKSLWSASETTGGAVNEPVSLDGQSIEQKVLSYIPNSKDLMLRKDGGCMLANGDIFCWGNNLYKKAGIETYGQLDTSLKPYYVNTPVMLKVQINDSTQKSLAWYNNPYRVKFQKMAMNSTNVCAVSPIFVGTTTKTGGDLYCNGQITSANYENIASGSTETSILSRNKYFADKTTNKIYLKDIAMVEDVIAILSDTGKIYVIGKNYKGSLGLEKDDSFYTVYTPTPVVANSNIVFTKIFALRDSRTFGAIDSNNLFYIWGERTNSAISKPSLIGSSNKFNPDAIFVNTNEFILKGTDGVYYKTKGNLEIESINSSLTGTPISLSYYKDNNNNEYLLYINSDLELKGTTSLLSCKESNESTSCDSTSSAIFNTSLNYLNTPNSETNSTYASFTNVSIFKLDQQISEISEDFQTRVTTGWKDYLGNNITTTTVVSNNGETTRTPATTYLGKFPISYHCTSNVVYGYGTHKTDKICTESQVLPYIVTKTYSFPGYANYDVDIEFDFYEIDSWDGERFEFYANNELLAMDHFVKDGHEFLLDSNITGTPLQHNVGTNSGENPQTYRYKLRTKLDSSGKVTLKFLTNLEFKGIADATNPPTRYDANGDPIYGNYWSKFDENPSNLNNESWGIDNVKVTLKETYKKFVCAMTGFTTASQMYCWGNVGRSIPILSTSLYDVSKISTINKLFISQESDKTTQMSFDNYNNSGNLFLKYPTYIGGFDYPFYFK
jgi:hypothetical protein